MLLTNEEVQTIYKSKKHLSIYDQLRAVEAAVLAKLLEQKPFCYHYVTNGTWDCYDKQMPPDDAYDEGSLVPLFTHAAPIPKEAP